MDTAHNVRGRGHTGAEGMLSYGVTGWENLHKIWEWVLY